MRYAYAARQGPDRTVKEKWHQARAGLKNFILISREHKLAWGGGYQGSRGGRVTKLLCNLFYNWNPNDLFYGVLKRAIIVYQKGGGGV